jgi:hypothetical protein
MLEFKCPTCSGPFVCKVDITIDKLDGFDFTCPCCDRDLLVSTGAEGNLLDLHNYLHACCPEWPENGEGTDYSELFDGVSSGSVTTR